MKYSGIWVVIPNQAWKTYGEIKPKQEWNESDNEKSEANPKAFYYILNGVSFDKFCRIITCKITQEAWGILVVTSEGISIVNLLKLQILVA